MPKSINSNSLQSVVYPVITPEQVSLLEERYTSPSIPTEKISLVIPMINVFGGLFGAWYGRSLTKDGLAETTKAMECKDEQGILLGLVNTGIGSTYAGMGLSMFGNGVVEVLPKLSVSIGQLAHRLIHIFTTVMNWLGVALYSLYIAGAVIALPELRDFRNAYTEILQKPRMSPNTKAIEVLHFFKAQISVTAEDRAQLKNASPEIEKKKLEMKKDQLIRKVGKECAEEIENTLPQLFEEVRAGKLENTEKLIAKVDRNSFKQVVTQIALVAAGVLGMMGSILSIAATGGLANYAFIVCASALYWLNGPIGDLLYKFYVPSTEKPAVCYNERYAVV